MVSVVSKAVAGYLAVVAGCVGTYASVNGGLYNFETEDSKEQVVDVLDEKEESEQLVQEGKVEVAEEAVFAAQTASEPKSLPLRTTSAKPETPPKQVQLQIPPNTANAGNSANLKNGETRSSFWDGTMSFSSITGKGQEAINQFVSFVARVTGSN